jgi:hypothetical protein
MSKLVFLIYQTGNWEWEYAEPYIYTPETEKQTPYTLSVPYTPRVPSTPAQLSPVDEDALLEEPIDRNYLHEEGVSDLNRRMAETSIESQSEDHQYSAGEQYSAGQQYPKYPEDNQIAEGEEYYQRHGDIWREKGPSEPQDHRRRDRKKGSSSKARDKNSGKNFAHSLELN